MKTVTLRDRSQRKGGKGGKKRNAHFMDVALQAYVRHVALNKLRDIEDCQEAGGVSLLEAIKASGSFVERAPYHQIWHKAWQEMILENPEPTQGTVFTAIEAMVGQAMMMEQEERKREAAPTVEDTSHYNAFIGSAMGRLLEEASGEVEEL